MLHEMLHVPLLQVNIISTMFNMLGGWRLFLSRAVAVFSNYSRAACEAIVVVTEWSEVFLKVALVCTSSLTVYLSILLKLNVLLRLMAAGVLYSREDGFRCSSPRACSSARCCGAGGGRCGKTWLRTMQSVLRVVSALCQCVTCVCESVLDLLHVAPSALSALSRSFRLTVCTVMTLCGCIRPVLLTLQTVTDWMLPTST